MKVRKVRNKNTLSPKPKKPPEKKTVVRFEFLGLDGEKYKLPFARLKINENGGASCLKKTPTGWIAVKGKLKSTKLAHEFRKPIKRD